MEFGQMDYSDVFSPPPCKLLRMSSLDNHGTFLKDNPFGFGSASCPASTQTSPQSSPVSRAEQPPRSPPQPPDFSSVSKFKVTKHFMISYRPRITLSVTLDGCDPVACIRSDSKYFVLSKPEIYSLFQAVPEWQKMNADEYVQLGFSAEPIMDCHLAKHPDGVEFKRQLYTEALPMDSDELTVQRFRLNGYAERKLANFLPEIRSHIARLEANAAAIEIMFRTVSDAYVGQFQVSHLHPHTSFLELASFVGKYVSPADVLKHFSKQLNDSSIPCTLAHYSLYSSVICQYDHIKTLLDQKI